MNRATHTVFVFWKRRSILLVGFGFIACPLFAVDMSINAPKNAAAKTTQAIDLLTIGPPHSCGNLHHAI
jgi:hypothetical protein